MSANFNFSHILSQRYSTSWKESIVAKGCKIFCMPSSLLESVIVIIIIIITTTIMYHCYSVLNDKSYNLYCLSYELHRRTQRGGSSGHASDTFERCPFAKSAETWLSWMGSFEVSLSPARQMPGYYRKLGQGRFLKFHSSSSFPTIYPFDGNRPVICVK
jgi:hypothetical protein